MENDIIFPQRESKVIEFKSSINQFDGIIKTSVAFANGVGGQIIVGVDDKTHSIVGIDDDLRDRIYDDFPNSLYDSTNPRLIAQIYEQRFGEKAVLIIEIPPCLKKPCMLRSKGMPKGVYLRIGSSTRAASEEHIEEMMRENQRLSYDGEAVPIDHHQLSQKLLNTYYQKISNAALLEDKIITRSAVNSEKYYPTIAGLLLFTDNPEQYIPEAHVICTRFAGVSGRDIIQTEEISGPISKQIDVSFNLVSGWLKRSYHLEGVHLKSKSIIPADALREAIINAVIHRKYTIPGATKIALYENRLEIFSPGNFPGHVNIDNLGDGITYLRNPVLGRMAHKMRLIEKLGSGIRLILDSCKAAKLASPIFSEDGDYVKVTFTFLPLKDEKISEKEVLLSFLEMQETVTMHEMVDCLGRSKNTVFKLVNQLLKQKLVKRIGKGPATRYTLNK